MLKTIGWRVIFVTGVIYGSMYLYEWVTWTNKAKEKTFKKQYVDHATKKLRLIVDLTSANCSHQVQQYVYLEFSSSSMHRYINTYFLFLLKGIVQHIRTFMSTHRSSHQWYGINDERIRKRNPTFGSCRQLCQSSTK